MNDEEQKEKKQDEGIIDKAKDAAKKGHKKGSTFKIIMKIMSVLSAIKPVIFIVLACLITVLLSGFIEADAEGSSNISGHASKSIIEENVDIAKTDDGRYYFKIDKDIINEYLKKLNEAYEEGYYYNLGTKDEDEKNEEDKEDDKEDQEQEGENKEEEEFNNETATIKKNVLENIFGTKDYEEYLIKMIRAEIASTYPVLSDYGLIEWDSEDKQGNKKDKEGN